MYLSEFAHYTTVLGSSRNGRSWDKVLHGESPVPILRALGNLAESILVSELCCQEGGSWFGAGVHQI